MNKRRLIYAIVEFLNRELASQDISEDAKEGLEVASQCLQTAYCLAPEDTHLAVSKPIDEMFNEATKNEPVRHASHISYSSFLSTRFSSFVAKEKSPTD